VPFLRWFLTVVALFACVLGMELAGRAGLSRFLSDEAIANRQLYSAAEAVRLEPADAGAYYVRGLLLAGSKEFDAAIDNFSQSIQLRPLDHLAWLQLGLAHESKGEESSAIDAFTEAVRLAPYYAQPHWHLGNSLLRSGHQKEAFTELSRAARSDPTLLREVVDLAWQAYDGNAEKVEQAVLPGDDAARVVLASVFVKRGRMPEAINLLRAAGTVANPYLYGLTVELIGMHRNRDAAEIWRLGGDPATEGQLNDGGFENSKISEATGFNWQTIRQPRGSRIVVDKENAQSGSRCLSVIFDGAISAEAEFVQQLVLLKPNVRYRLAFYSRTEDLNSNGLPLVAVVEANPSGRLLVLSNHVPPGTSDWRKYSVEFETTSLTEAAYISIQRQKCQDVNCPIFGQVWFDSFSLEEL
jgi:hypothetical protein